MTTALYRINGGEVLKISVQGQPFADRDAAVFGVLTDPTLPDGQAVREDLGDGTLGPIRVLGFAKVAVVGSNTVRNATAPEIAAFATAETSDENALDAADAGRMIDTHPRFRKVLKALLKRIIAENNDQRTQWNALRAQIAAATNLANLQSRVAANTTDLPTRTLQQAVTALKNDVSSSD